MKILFFFCIFFMLVSQAFCEPRSQICRVTFYSPGPKWGSKVACPKTKKAVEGVTVAAKKSIPFGTKVYIPALAGVIGDGHFVVQDRGPAVDRKRASRGKADVIDVFVSNRSVVRRMKTRVNDYLKVYFLN